MQFSLLILSAPPASQAPLTALNFARAAIAGGHQIRTVFFYGDGVQNANAHAAPAADEVNVPSEWQRFADDSGCELISCSASSLRRGVLDPRESERHDRSGASLLDGASLGGLGLLAEACQQSDRLVSFA